MYGADLVVWVHNDDAVVVVEDSEVRKWMLRMMSDWGIELKKPTKS